MARRTLPQMLDYLNDDYILVASIDFGTTFSGYAFSFRNDKNDIKMNKNWGTDYGYQSFKTPTSVLLGKGGEFLAFGYEAGTKYNEMVISEGPKSCELYRHFKMKLHHESRLTRKTLVESVGGQKANALDIFSNAVRCLRQHLLKALKISVKSLPKDLDIRWVLTVPAIWSEKSRSFMREVAFKAGLTKELNSKRLVICLEPEAASNYCRQLEISGFIKADSKEETMLRKPGAKYMIIDAGGGTIDITSHETDSRGKIKELAIASGGPWGGTMIDSNFICLLKEILGSDFLNKLQSIHPSDWLKLRVEFESKKKRFDPKDPKSKISFQLSYNLFKAYSDFTGRDLAEKLSSSGVQGVHFCGGALIIEKEPLMKIFQPVIEMIVHHIDKQMKSSTLKDIDLMLLVGGFGECKMLQDTFIKKYGKRTPVLCPNEAGVSIIKGAVLFGHEPQTITSRIARKTYGQDGYTESDETIHDEHRRKVLGRGPRCLVFNPYVKKGERVDIGEERTFTCYPKTSTQTKMNISLLSANIANVEFPDGPTVNEVGEIAIELPDTSKGLKRKCEVKAYFGATEIHVKAREVTDGMDGKEVHATIDFLAD